jgi:bifunctional DNA-binding transcriptional regulator/antitoxin component of YhaV-PrlF toxin-antitoxin module
MQKVTTVDEKGRVTIPIEFREDLGHEVVVTKTKTGVLLSPGKKKDFIAEFLKLIESEPRRTGKAANPSPAAMKGIWREDIE